MTKLSVVAPRSQNAADPAIIEEAIAGRGGSIRLVRFVGRASGPTILYLHEGGEQPLVARYRPCRHIAHVNGIQVIAVEYRCPAKHSFVEAVEDAVDAFAMLQLRGKEWGIDPARIALMGDGTGSALAAIVALHARDLCLPMPIAQLLLCPLTEMPRPGGDGIDWREQPLQAVTLAGLPPTFLAVHGPDPFQQQGAAFAQRLAAAGVETRLRYVSGEARVDEALAFLTKLQSS
jgi:acetyl esterase